MIFKHLKYAASNALGLQELSVANKSFIITHVGFLIFSTLPGLFVNTFFYRQDGRISTIALYSAICWLGIAFFMQFTSFIMLKTSAVFCLRVGVIIFNLFYLVLLLLQQNAVHYIFVLGLLSALASSFYWQSYLKLLQDFTDTGSMNRTLSILSLAGSAASLVLPMVSGVVISNLPGSLGYYAVFSISFVFSLVTAFLTSRIPVSRVKYRSNLILTYKTLLRAKSARLMMIGEFTRGMRDVVFPLYISMVFFKVVENEAILGLNTMVSGLGGVISCYLAGRYINEGNKLKFLMITPIIMLVVALPTFIAVTSTVLFVLAAVNTFLAVFISNPAMSTMFNMFKRFDKDFNTPQIMAVREVFLESGRSLGLLIFVLLSANAGQYAIAFLLLNLTAVLNALIVKWSVHEGHREQLRTEQVASSPMTQ